MKKFVLQDGNEIVDISQECDYERLTPEEKIQYMMLQISRHLMKFVIDIAVSENVNDIYSARITGDGTYYMLEMCNGYTKAIYGKMWTYQEILELCIKPSLIENTFNGVVRMMIVKAASVNGYGETIWL